MGWLLSSKHTLLVLTVPSVFISFFFFSYSIFYLICFLYYLFSVMVLTHLAFALVIFISSSMIIICNFLFFFTYITRSVKL